VEVEAAFNVDGSIMEGGGQILRVAIALATLLNVSLLPLPFLYGSC
jgi:hypothetical protein